MADLFHVLISSHWWLWDARRKKSVFLLRSVAATAQQRYYLYI